MNADPRAFTAGGPGGPSSRPKAALAARIGLALWLVCSVGGLAYLMNYAAGPGLDSLVPAAWPSESAIRRESGAATLLVFLHPHCPCSSATIGELERALARTSAPVRIFALFHRPDGVDDTWMRTRLRSRFERLEPACAIVEDAGGESSAFRITTSGHVLLYDASGVLLFEGGVTRSRGHEGDNSGASALASHLLGKPAPLVSTPVYGCPLRQDLSGCEVSHCPESQP